MKNFLVLICLLGSCMLAMGQDKECACCTENHRAFDFWVGNWEVTTAEGKEAGKNVIEKVQGGCIIRENWTSARGGLTGSSVNFFNSEAQQWEQLWVDNNGNHLKLSGKRSGNQMIMSSEEFTHTDGKAYRNRITWTLNENGSVRQLWELLQGDTVAQILFDGQYKKIMQ